MADIAEIGFRADTSDLDKAVVKLNAIKPAAAGAAKGAEQVVAAVEGASRSLNAAAVSAAKAEKLKADAVLQSARASKSASTADIEAAVAAQKQASSALATVKAEHAKQASLNASAIAYNKVKLAAIAAGEMEIKRAAAMRRAFNSAAIGSAGSRKNSDGPIPANDQMPNRFNTGNIAAQFQDIGVTAAMGMNPLTIALQQGTQLSAILQTMENPLKGISIAFKQLFNTISLGTIAIVALIATAIELINWIKVAQGVLNDLASVIQNIGPYILGLAATLAVLYGSQIIGGILMVTARIAGIGVAAFIAGTQMAAAWVIGLGPIGWLIIGIAGIVTALGVLSKEFENTFAGKMLSIIKKAVNTAIAIFYGLGEAINAIFTKGGESIGDAFNRGFSEASKKDIVGEIGNFVQQTADDAAEQLRKLARSLGVDKNDKFAKVINKGERDLAALKAEQDAMGLSENAAAKLKYETELLNDAKEKNIKLTDAQRGQLSDLAQKMADVSIQTSKNKEALDFAKDATKGFISDLRNGLQQGQSLWQSFGNAVNNVINKIIDKMTDLAIDDLFQGTGKGGGSGVGSMITSAFKWLFNAKGNVFSAANDNGVVPFAKGGMFTNSIVTKPTSFAFGRGGQFGGVMGEAGPEAVMPLSRGPNGSLGVKAHGSGGGGAIVNIYESPGTKATVNQRQTSNGPEIDVIIDEAVAAKVGQQGTAINRGLQARDSRQMIRR